MPDSYMEQGLPGRPTTVILGGGQLPEWNDLRRSLSRRPGLMLAQCSESPDEIFSYCRQLSPCVLIVDGKFIEKVNPVEFTTVTDLGRSVRVLVRVEEEPSETLEKWLRMGCAGFLPERTSPVTLRKAIGAVASGELWVSRKMVSRIVQDLLLAGSPRKLTRREVEILQLLGRGYTNREIAKRLFVSRETVRWHMRSLYAKIGVHDRASAGDFALSRSGQIQSELASAQGPRKSIQPPKPALRSVG